MSDKTLDSQVAYVRACCERREREIANDMGEQALYVSSQMTLGVEDIRSALDMIDQVAAERDLYLSALLCPTCQGRGEYLPPDWEDCPDCADARAKAKEKAVKR